MNNNFKAFEFGIRIATGLPSDPVSGRQGEIYYNTTSNTLRLNTSNTPTWTSIGGGVSIGSPVGGSTPNGILYIDSSGNLAEDVTNFSWNDGTQAMYLAGTLQVTGSLVDSSSVASVIPATRIAQDSTAVNSINWNTRLLIDTAANTAVDWHNRRLYYALGTNLSIYWQDGQLRDNTGSNALSILWGNRELIWPDGSTPAISWATQGELSISGVAYTWPSVQGATGTVLQDSDGAGTLVWANISDVPGDRSMSASWSTGLTYTLNHNWGTVLVMAQVLDSAGNNYANIEINSITRDTNNVYFTSNMVPPSAWTVIIKEIS